MAGALSRNRLARKNAKEKSLLFFANFAYFAALRETCLSIRGLIHRCKTLEQMQAQEDELKWTFHEKTS